MTLGRKQAIIGGLVLATIVAVGWIVAVRYATNIAKDGVDGFIIRHNLHDVVSYNGIYASPFGKVRLDGVAFKIGGLVFHCGDVMFSGLGTDRDIPSNVDIVLSNLNIPTLDLARMGNPVAAFFSEMGYTSLQCQIGLSYHLDDKGNFTVKTTGDVSRAGSWNFSLRLANVEQETFSALAVLQKQLSAVVDSFSGTPGRMKRKGASDFNENDLANLLGAGSQFVKGLSAIKFASMDFVVNDSGIYDNMRKLPDEPLPSGSNSVVSRAGKMLAETSLVMAGMGPSAAREIVAKVNGWIEKGGEISLATRLEHPIALIRPSVSSPEPVFDSFETFLVATKAKIR
ncbi:MAG TPA: hypothetical protein PKC79_02675 [Solidesulfovibrio magneticus]|nr:hypothetical protein [Solidesulfovibrio magneticus]